MFGRSIGSPSRAEDLVFLLGSFGVVEDGGACNSGGAIIRYSVALYQTMSHERRFRNSTVIPTRAPRAAQFKSCDRYRLWSSEPARSKHTTTFRLRARRACQKRVRVRRNADLGSTYCRLSDCSKLSGVGCTHPFLMIRSLDSFFARYRELV